MIYTTEQIEALEAIAKQNNGKCDRCGRIIKIYTYHINKSHAILLRRIADKVKETGINVINLNDIEGTYSQKTQRTKLRLHGLIAKHKKEGVQVASEWVITTKGFRFLAGDPIPRSVIVFDNTVLGHRPQVTDIRRITGDDIVYEELPISPAEAQVYKDVRTNPRKNVKYLAMFKGNNLSGFDDQTVYEIELDGLRTGKPIVMSRPLKWTFSDVAEFQKQWKILSEIKEEVNNDARDR